MQTLNIEIVLKNHSTVSKAEIIAACFMYLCKRKIKTGMIISTFDDVEHRILYYEVQNIVIEDDDSNAYLNLTEVRINWYVYSLDQNGPQLETCEDDHDTAIDLATHWVLPSAELFNLWENLIYDTEIKDNLLKYASTMMGFSDKGIDNNIITCNRVVLLHGPPGTGKTSLCKALSQKLSIRMQERYKQTVLIEINSHSLFSKWFSESGKLVTKLFSKIKEIVEDPQVLVCVLIDEIESLAHAREQCMSGNEPSDSIRVVNAVLTQIDQIKRYPNVIILATSNITGAIDIAFIDRADIKQYLGLPSVPAIYQIYYSCLHELFRIGVIHSKDVFEDMDLFKSYEDVDLDTKRVYTNTERLIKLSQDSVGLSGRVLRKIPFLAHALFVEEREKNLLDLGNFLDAMAKAITYEKSQRNSLPAKLTD